MSRRFVALLLAACVAIPCAARAEVYFAFSAEQLEYQGNQRVFFVPFSFTATAYRQTERRIAVLFEKLHGSRQAVYGDTFLIVKEQAGDFTAHLILDESATRFHDIIIGEVYLTLANIGITKLTVGPEARQVTDTDVKYPYFIPTIPLWEALPPSTFPHALIRLGPDEYVESKTFYAQMGKRDVKLYARVLDLLKSTDAYVKLRVLGSFPHLAVTNENDYLLPLLADESPGVRYKVIELLREKKEPAALDALAKLADASQDPETQLRSARILVANGRNLYQIYILFEDLKNKDKAVVIQTLQKLASSGDKRVLPAMIRMLTHEDEEVRKAAFAGLMQIRDLPTLKAQLTNKEISEDFRKSIAVELMKQNASEFAKEGITYLVKNHAGPEVVEAITTVEMRGYKDLADLLVFSLVHPDEKVALSGVSALGTLELFDRMEALSSAASRKELATAVRDTLAKLLGRLPVKEVMSRSKSPDLLIRELSVLALVACAKAKPDPKENEPILALLDESMKDKDGTIKRAAVTALFEIGGAKNWNRLLKMVKDSDPKLRILVGQAALSLADPAGDAVLLELLADESDEVRVAAIVAARERKIKAAREKLKFLVESRDKLLKTEALKTIVALNENQTDHQEFFEIYKKYVFEMDAEIQLASVQGLQWIVDPMVVPLLQSGILIMHKDARVRAATLIALGRSKDYNVIEHIARGFADSEIDVQKAAIEGLRLMGSKKGLTPLKEFIKQTDDEELKSLAQAAADELQAGPKGLLD
jgi:HEAT repeat protein